MYQLMWTLPQWDSLVTKHMAKHDTSVWYAAILLLAFGATFHVHRCGEIYGVVWQLESTVGHTLLCAKYVCVL